MLLTARGVVLESPVLKWGVSTFGMQAGTIGGGNVEHTLYQEALYMLKNGYKEAKIVKKVHQDDGADESSGMICSGEQQIMFYPLFENNLPMVSEIIEGLNSYDRKQIEFLPDKIILKDKPVDGKDNGFSVNVRDWSYKENLYKLTDVYIFGAGHVCLALSETLSRLGFYITIVDDRPDLDLLKKNHYAHNKITMDYDEIADKISGDNNAYYIIMTHSHSADSKVLAQLIKKEHKYLGMMGSPVKVKEIYEELQEQGISESELKKIHAPIGVSINSKTPEEISISIAAELIKERNA